MNEKTDMKSLLLGMALGVSATVAVAAVSSTGQVGRFQLGGTNNQGMVIDTATGQVWSTYFSPSGGMGHADFFEPKIGEKK